MKILVVFGTRPEAIKCFPVIEELRRRPGVEVVACTTAQHRHILDQVMELVGLVPDIDLHLMREKPTLTDITTDVLHRVGEVLAEVRPDRVLVQGDTTTAMATAMAAFYHGVPVGHIEAGLRTDTILSPWPEEANRRIVSVITDMHFAPTRAARDNLLRENIDPASVFLTGNTVIDALHSVRARLAAAKTSSLPDNAKLRDLLDQGRKLILMTAHRRENWGEGIDAICRAARQLADRGDVVIALPVHPNPRVSVPVRAALGDHPAICLLEPLGYAEFVSMLGRCEIVLTDSGGVQEEAPALGKPVLVLRDTTERPEGVEAGCARLIGLDARRIVEEATRLLDDPEAYGAMSHVANPYGDGTAARQIADAILSNARGQRARAVGA
ncbi:non-hydrolyzing UDP-N-acetylglucosamine 2-epimerase [Albidovulum sp.]|uniref:non-hydrolyzing UDP-N-acetylglucosamine 2-epimerase n=1 Tax=Albidovulum sp. TaxID=1872424 RepID=UPI001D20EFA0|nr:UDP-N-acetylglucosamine 2-epimerase (non-hydrolyzing) [Paracoccaceae bacterium]